MELALHEIDCPMCGGGRRAPLIEAPDPNGPDGPWFAVVCCQDCGLCYTSPRPGESDMARFYRADYGPHQAAAVGPADLRPPGLWSGLAGRLRRGTPDRRWLAPRGQMRLLDVGCGSGFFLARMHAQGWRVTGLDASEAAVRRVRDELRLPALVGTLPHPGLTPGAFDVITLWQSLEHVYRPLDALRTARELLAPGGRLIVSVPNIAGAPFRWFGPAWTGLELPRHLTHFSPATLQEMLRRAGFEAGPVTMVRHVSWLRRSAREARRRRIGPWWIGPLRIHPISRAVAWWLALRGESDCIMVTAEEVAAR
jgi:SAM-dependent methyltransferase